MKRLTILKSTLLFTGILALGQLRAQTPIAEVWSQPAAFLPTDSVTWYFDVTGTPLDGESSTLYLWSWVPSEPDAGHWTNSSDFAALTQVSGNIWKIKLQPTGYYNLPADQISHFAGLLKTKDGSKQTEGFDLYTIDLTDLKTSGLLSWYPADIDYNRPFSILINAAHTWSNCSTTAVQGALLNASRVSMHSGINGWQNVIGADNSKSTMSQVSGTTIFRIDIEPGNYYGIDENTTIDGINLVISGDNWQTEGKAEGCQDFYIQNHTSGTNDQVSATSSITVYPNPVSGERFVTISCPDGNNYVLYDMSGIICAQGQIVETAEIAIGSLQNGIYILKVNHINGLQSTQKIIKH